MTRSKVLPDLIRSEHQLVLPPLAALVLLWLLCLLHSDAHYATPHLLPHLFLLFPIQVVLLAGSLLLHLHAQVIRILFIHLPQFLVLQLLSVPSDPLETLYLGPHILYHLGGRKVLLQFAIGSGLCDIITDFGPSVDLLLVNQDEGLSLSTRSCRPACPVHIRITIDWYSHLHHVGDMEIQSTSSHISGN